MILCYEFMQKNIKSETDSELDVFSFLRSFSLFPATFSPLTVLLEDLLFFLLGTMDSESLSSLDSDLLLLILMIAMKS